MPLKRRRDFPRDNAKVSQKFILVLFCVSLVFFVFAQISPIAKKGIVEEEMVMASNTMHKATESLRKSQEEKGLFPDNAVDINQTGLIGLEYSPITTSLGDLAAKRTTTDPNFAGLVVYLLRKAGVEKGDTVAVGASASFPALVVAVLSAAKAMNVRLLVIGSLGASQWGANNPDFHWLDMINCLNEKGVFDTNLIALSLGGDRDVGRDMDPDAKLDLKRAIEENGTAFVDEENLKKNVSEKMAFYEEIAGVGGIQAFVNIGGSYSDLGTDPSVLDLKPGLTKVNHIPQVEKRGVIHEMAVRNIPVIHLLFIKGLVQRFGLSWDPFPLPSPGKGRIYRKVRQEQASFFFLSVFYLLTVFSIFFLSRHKF